MKMELIKVQSDNEKQLVSARELHKALNVKTRFSQWVEQNFKHFRKGNDFTSVVTTTVVNNGAKRELQDYALSVEMAKHIAMMSGTEKGYEIRDYFIQVEQAWNSPEMIMKRALEIANKKVEQLKIENEQMKPKALFADAVTASHTSILVGDLAIILKQNGVDIGAKRLFRWLRGHGYLIKRKGTSWNMPTQKSMELGLFEVKERAVTNSDGSVRITKTTKVTGKGQVYFVNKFQALMI
ncbi:phage antirepressor KilAC domain-containing protein [Enterococcus cecorum]|uniref:phage antirepressor KilAC domain-containing protein n=1 Tax=Enterococcus cecorum TaxID=44008 RepID=UPI001AD80881|nr:phage antirepressor KilAC domain-containing protein [Enterococcus cecorum]MCJ0535922.1 phage antirepressor KilAC domain-containing protein [Enterococcus cecorum]MCJ0554977.1 phage antirepressor KilAC domain-containing protein [Enterococcus cecorum]